MVDGALSIAFNLDRQFYLMQTTYALVAHADAMRLRVAHEECMLTALFHRLGPVLFCRHLWGVANEAADKASRFLNDMAEGALRGLGLVLEWRSLPNWVAEYFERVILRLRSMNLPLLLPGSEYRRFARMPLRNNDPAEAEQVDYQHDVRAVDMPTLAPPALLNTSSLHPRPSTATGCANASTASASGALIDISRLISITSTTVPSARHCADSVDISTISGRVPLTPRNASIHSGILDIASLAGMAPPAPQVGGAKRNFLQMPSPPNPKRENARWSPITYARCCAAFAFQAPRHLAPRPSRHSLTWIPLSPAPGSSRIALTAPLCLAR